MALIDLSGVAIGSADTTTEAGGFGSDPFLTELTVIRLQDLAASIAGVASVDPIKLVGLQRPTSEALGSATARGVLDNPLAGGNPKLALLGQKYKASYMSLFGTRIG